MKLHIGVDGQTGMGHSAVVTAANVHDKHPLPDLLHGQERRIYGDCAYASQSRLIHTKAPGAVDLTNQTVRTGSLTEGLERMVNRAKSRVRSRVEYIFAVVKRLWGFGKVRYRGLAKNATRAFVATRWPTSSWHAGACWHECVCMVRRLRPMRCERANSPQLASQDSARAACGYEPQCVAGLISVALASSPYQHHRARSDRRLVP